MGTMNVIQRMHSDARSDEGTPVHKSTGNSAPFWVRHYDMVVNLVTLGRPGVIHQQTVALADLRPGDAVLDVGCGTGALLLEAETVVGPEGVLVGLDKA